MSQQNEVIDLDLEDDDPDGMESVLATVEMMLEDIIWGWLPDSYKTVVIKQDVKNDAYYYTIVANLEDRGLLIGKAGENISALRKVFKQIGRSNGIKIYVNVYED